MGLTFGNCHVILPKNEEITWKLPWTNLGESHTYNKEKSLPIAPSALIDINNDNIDEVFFGGGMGQKDVLLAYRNGKFIDVSSEVNLPTKNEFTTLSAVSADF